MDIIINDDGECFDLHTFDGCYQYVGTFLKDHGADSKTFACLGRLYSDSEKGRRVLAVIDEFKEKTGHVPGNNDYWWGKFEQALSPNDLNEDEETK